jgi:membrane-associated phospholipid phosphatase
MRSFVDLRSALAASFVSLAGLGHATAAPAADRGELVASSSEVATDTGEAPPDRAATPIVPEPSRRPQRAYQLYWEIDLPVLGVAAVLGAARIARTEGNSPAFCVQQIPQEQRATVACDPDELNPIDRPIAGRWSPGWATFSDYTLLGLAAAPIAVLWVDEGLVNTLNDVVVIYQSMLIAASLSGISSMSAGRGRPYVYGTEAPLGARQSPEGGLAFFSGHSAMAFAVSTSTFWTLQRTHPDGALPWVALGVGSAGASSVALARVLAGRHFPTDVIAGTVVGVGIGTLIPMLHGIPVQVIPELDQNAANLTLVGAF